MARVGVVGAGFMGTMHSQVYSLLPDAKLVGVADIRKDKAEELAHRFNCSAYSDPEELLKIPEVDAIDICLPTFLHAEWMIKAAQAGKDVICEKPIALKIKDAERMVKTAEKHKVIFMVAQTIRFWPEYVRLKEIYDKKELGQLVSLHLTRLSPLPVWGWENWIIDVRKSGSALFDLHIHDADYLLFLLGKPESVYTWGRKVAGGYYHVLTSYQYPKLMVTAEGGWDFPDTFPFRMSFVANFEKGTVEYNSLSPKPFAIYTAGKSEFPQLEVVVPQGVAAGGNISTLVGYYQELKYFVDCVRDRREPTVVTPEDAKNSLALVYKELESAEKGKEIIL